MTLLTLNTHSLKEKNYQKKLSVFVSAVKKHKIDVIALQEIMQPVGNEASDFSHINCGKIQLKKGNHALNIVNSLANQGEKYNLVWCGFKRSYNSFDEGLAILTPHIVEDTMVVTLTPFDDYDNWKTRKALGVKIKGEWFYSVHMGWWDSFEYEFSKLKEEVLQGEQVWLMGDFNAVADERGKGYDCIISSGIFDTYKLADNKDNGITAHTGIDGWGEGKTEIRIDYIFSSKKREVESSYVIFNGTNEEVVSDHFGIIVKEKK